MPFEDDDVSEDEFCLQLSIIDDIIQRLPDCFVICGEDFNVDFQRDRTHTERLNEFCRNMPLQPACMHSCSLVDYTYNFNMHRFSIIDHFIVSEALFDEAITRMYVKHEIDNRSDHDPIFMHLSIDYDRFSITPRAFTSRLVWQRASNKDKMSYQESLRTYLSEISLPTEVLLCHNTVCCHAEHDERLSLYARNILEACLLAGETHISVTRPASMARVPGWTEYVAPYREKSLFWHHIWIDNGRPKTGIIANIMRTTRAAYHNAIRSVNRNRADIVNERFADAILSNNTRDFWHEAKRIRGVNASYSNNIDDLSSHDDIANMFASNTKSCTPVSPSVKMI
jgi:hypothetical protein